MGHPLATILHGVTHGRIQHTNFERDMRDEEDEE